MLESVPAIEEPAGEIPSLLLPDGDLDLPALPDQEVLGDEADAAPEPGSE